MPESLADRVRSALGIKTDTEVMREVIREPSVKKARTQLRRVDHILAELERMEGKRGR